MTYDRGQRGQRGQGRIVVNIQATREGFILGVPTNGALSYVAIGEAGQIIESPTPFPFQTFADAMTAGVEWQRRQGRLPAKEANSQ